MPCHYRSYTRSLTTTGVRPEALPLQELDQACDGLGRPEALLGPPGLAGPGAALLGRNETGPGRYDLWNMQRLSQPMHTNLLATVV